VRAPGRDEHERRLEPSGVRRGSTRSRWARKEVEESAHATRPSGRTITDEATPP
jgi:hypothetical protein